MEFSYSESTDTGTNMVTKDYSKSRMRENCKYGSVRGGQSNLIPSTRLTALRAEGFGIALRAMSIYAASAAVVGGLMDTPFGREGSKGSKGSKV